MPASEILPHEGLRGHLFKWTNYLRGYQKRWFILQNGLVSYYRNQAEMAHTCRGTINLASATIISTGITTFLISNSNTQTFHLKAMTESDQKMWVLALRKEKAIATELLKDGDDSDNFVDNEDEGDYKNTSSAIGDDCGLTIIERSLTAFEARLHDLQNCQDALNRKADDLQKVICELEAAKDASGIIQRCGRVKERVYHFKVAASAVKNSCSQYTMFASAQSQRWRRAFSIQQRQCTLFEKMIEELAMQLRQLEYLMKQKNPQAMISAEQSILAFGATASSSLNVPGQAVRIHPGDVNKSSPSTLSGCNSNTTSSQHTSADAKAVDVLSTVSKDSQSTSVLLASSSPAEPVGASGHGKTVSVSTARPFSVATKEDGRVGENSEPEMSGHDDEDYFYDAEEVSPDFSVYLPFTSPNLVTDARTADTTKVLPMAQSGEKASGSDLDIPTDTDLANEYESDAQSNSETEIAEKSQHLLKKNRFCEARVVRYRVKKRGNAPGSSEAGVAEAAPVAPDEASFNAADSSVFVPIRPDHPGRRTTIPPKPKISLNLWSVMKNCIGKELTKIPMPVNFSEPLSMLQRLTEDFAYSPLLDKAASCGDTLQQMGYVAAFSVSAYATTAVRIGKPFNPLLNETYECDRTDDLGWRCLAEQVSHHPPMCALHCESNQWYCWFQFSMTTKFRGKYLQILPLGTVHLVFRRTGHEYVWEKIPLTVHNIIVGRLWIDNSGEMDLVNLGTGEKCHLSYKAYSYFSNDTPRSVTGVITDRNGAASHVLKGTWDASIECAPVLSTRYARGSGKPILETGPSSVLWQAQQPPYDADRMYNFNEFAVQLNQPEDGVCPTDSRFRPDQRLMEAGQWDEANRAKILLEEKQRQRRRDAARALVASAEDCGRQHSGNTSADLSAVNAVCLSAMESIDNQHKPLWFERRWDPHTNRHIFSFNGQYWTRKAAKDWSNVPDIY